jgi:hypothetical protein
LAVILAGSLAQAGYYGGVSREAHGFRASIDIRVGHSPKRRDEGREIEQRKADADKVLARTVPQLERAYRHFVSGKHPYARLVSRLAQVDEPPEGDRAVMVFVQSERQPDEIRMAAGQLVRVWLYTRELPGKELGQKLAVDFACAQVFGGALVPQPHGVGDLVEAQDELRGMNTFDVDPYSFLHRASELRPELAALAARSEPLPPKSKWGAEPRVALVTAKVLDAFFSRAPYSPALLAAAGGLSQTDRVNVARLMALLLPDRRGLDQIAPLVRDDEQARAWLQALEDLYQGK